MRIAPVQDEYMKPVLLAPGCNLLLYGAIIKHKVNIASTVSKTLIKNGEAANMDSFKFFSFAIVLELRFLYDQKNMFKCNCYLHRVPDDVELVFSA